jgi:hypothetical protein
MTAEHRIRPTWAGEVERLHELLVAQATRSGEPYVTVEFTRNAKGDTQINTKVSAPGGCDVEALTELSATVYGEAVTIYERANMRYPTPDAPATPTTKAVR